ncbi:MAG: hypothetical protein Q4F97_08430 [Bacteroidales bacterium]|nr:hypothetical protein [Bacteroidales bacterium]
MSDTKKKNITLTSSLIVYLDHNKSAILLLRDELFELIINLSDYRYLKG